MTTGRRGSSRALKSISMEGTPDLHIGTTLREVASFGEGLVRGRRASNAPAAVIFLPNYAPGLPAHFNCTKTFLIWGLLIIII